jgi:flagellar motor switch/type III secretory pathway protein FliN
MAQDQQNAPSETGINGSSSVLHRKAATGRAEHEARSVSIARALRLSAAKVADDLFDMAVAAISVRTQEVAGPDLIEFFDDSALLLLFDGPNSRRAAVVCSSTLVGALIQQQTMGKVLKDDGGQARSMTGTDAAVCAPFLDGLLERAATLPETDEDRTLLAGYRFGARAEDARLLHLAMEAPHYQVIHLELDIDRGNRQGQIVLCLPVPDQADTAEDQLQDGDQPKARSENLKTRLADTVPLLPIELSLVLATLKMPLSKIGALQVGDLLDIKHGCFDAVEIRTIQGCKVGKGTLGQLDGYRAVRIAQPEGGHDQRRSAPGKSSDSEQVEAGDVPTSTKSLLPHTDATVEPQSDLPAPFDEDMSLENVAGNLEPQELPDMSDIPSFDDLDLPNVAQG